MAFRGQGFAVVDLITRLILKCIETERFKISLIYICVHIVSTEMMHSVLERKSYL